MQNAGRIRRPPLRARLLAEIKSPAICWEAKTSLSAGAYSLEQALMWQNLSEPLTLWGEAGAAPGLAVDFWRLHQAPNPAAARPVCCSPGATPWPQGELGHGRVKNICIERQHQPRKHGKRLPSLALHSTHERRAMGVGGLSQGPQKRWKALCEALQRNSRPSLPLQSLRSRQAQRLGKTTMKHKSWLLGSANSNPKFWSLTPFTLCHLPQILQKFHQNKLQKKWSLSI